MESGKKISSQESVNQDQEIKEVRILASWSQKNAKQHYQILQATEEQDVLKSKYSELKNKYKISAKEKEKMIANLKKNSKKFAEDSIVLESLKKSIEDLMKTRRDLKCEIVTLIQKKEEDQVRFDEILCKYKKVWIQTEKEYQSMPLVQEVRELTEFVQTKKKENESLTTFFERLKNDVKTYKRELSEKLKHEFVRFAENMLKLEELRQEKFKRMISKKVELKELEEEYSKMAKLEKPKEYSLFEDLPDVQINIHELPTNTDTAINDLLMDIDLVEDLPLENELLSNSEGEKPEYGVSQLSESEAESIAPSCYSPPLITQTLSYRSTQLSQMSLLNQTQSSICLSPKETQETIYETQTSETYPSPSTLVNTGNQSGLESIEEVTEPSSNTNNIETLGKYQELNHDESVDQQETTPYNDDDLNRSYVTSYMGDESMMDFTDMNSECSRSPTAKEEDEPIGQDPDKNNDDANQKDNEITESSNDLLDFFGKKAETKNEGSAFSFSFGGASQSQAKSSIFNLF